MNQEMVERLSVITREEQDILRGNREIDRTLYMDRGDMVIDSRKLLHAGKMITIRPHTRFVHFPAHTHNYVEVIYMCQGHTTHIVDGNRVELKAGELLFLNQHATQMMGEEENLLREFLVGCLCDDTRYDRYLHFQVSDVLPIQNLMENMVWSLLNEQPGKRSINQATMGLVLLHLMHYTGRLRMSPDSGQSLEQKLTFQVLRYIEEHYREGTLAELAGIMGYDVYCLSRMIKQVLGRNYKELLQVKRLNQAAFLLQNTGMNIVDISVAVGYDNTSYFHRIFKGYYGQSPREYRLSQTLSD